MRRAAILFLIMSAGSLPVTASAAIAGQSARSLGLSQAVNDIMELPICSDKVTTNCRKHQGSNWLVIGGLAIAGAIAAFAACGCTKQKPASP